MADDHPPIWHFLVAAVVVTVVLAAIAAFAYVVILGLRWLFGAA